MNCEIYKDLVAAHVDSVLSSDEHKDAEEHLGACQECQLLFRQQQEFQLNQGADRLAFIDIVRDCPIETIHTLEPSLEDVFLKLTGRGLD